MKASSLCYLAGALAAIALPALAISFSPGAHRGCVERRSEMLKHQVYSEVPERADYAADVYCRRHGDTPLPQQPRRLAEGTGLQADW